MPQVTLTIDESYVVPEGPLTPEQYVEFVMNRAVESYKNVYKTETFAQGLEAACAAYNDSLPETETPDEEQVVA